MIYKTHRKELLKDKTVRAQDDRKEWLTTAQSIIKQEKGLTPKKLATRVRKMLSLDKKREQSIYRFFLLLKNLNKNTIFRGKE